MRIDGTTKIYLGGVEQVKIKQNGVVIWEKQQQDINYFYIENTYQGQNTVSLTTTQSGTPTSGTYATSVEYSKDKSTWTTLTLTAGGSNSITLNSGEKVYFRNDSGYWSVTNDSDNSYVKHTITSTNTIATGGNISSILDYTNMNSVSLSVGCFSRLFYNNTNLTTAPELSYTTLAGNCYREMFKGCTSLTTPPLLPATTLDVRCYQSMFLDCTSLTSAPALPAMSATFGCYNRMFNNCTSLTTAPSLPATTLADACYSYMFEGCSGLTTAPSLPATTLTLSCYQGMFRNCTNLTTPPQISGTIFSGASVMHEMFRGCSSLTTAPSLPATTLGNDCYRGMFHSCSSLTTAPVLPATTLVTRCYANMFTNCTSLNTVITYANDISATNCIVEWLSDVAATGDFYNFGSATYTTGISGIPTGWTEQTYFYIENTYGGNNTVTITTTQNGSPTSGTYTTSVEYSKDKSNWTTLTLTAGVSNSITLNQGEKVYFRNNSGVFNYTDDSKSYYTGFDCSEQFDIGGNINTLLDYEHLDNITLPQGCFSRMFINAKVVNASNLKLPSTTLSPHCYRAFLNNCASLITSPELPATTLADKCYYAMLYGCSSLTTFQDKLPATTLVFGCYDSMFRGCSSLSKAPELPAVTLANYCYSNMFYSCSNLSEIKIGATSWNSTYSNNWLRDAGSSVLGTKTAYVKTGTTIPTGNSGIPSNWTIVYY